MKRNKTAEERMADSMLGEQRAKSRPAKFFIAGVVGYTMGSAIGWFFSPNYMLSPGFGWSGAWWIADIWSIVGGLIGTVAGLLVLKAYYRHQDSK